ncbi:MAG: hypothetical protein NTY03_04120, partial [Candidatus Bathyarchaeota archaeon]|nr:hypothetical protein [Candidatus Bathyarchaeota archaeon]
KGLQDGRDGSSYTTKSSNNTFHDNTVIGAYYGVWVEYLATQSVVVYDNTLNVYKNECKFSD